MTFKRRGGRKEIIVPEDFQAANMGRSKTQRPLVVAFARAFRWQELLESGKVASIAALTKHLKVDRAYISRILNLTLLTSDIVRTIMNGERARIGIRLIQMLRR